MCLVWCWLCHFVFALTQWDPKESVCVDHASLQHQTARDVGCSHLTLLRPLLGCRMPLVEATRKWRKGVRTYVAFEQPVHSEMSIAKAVMVSLLTASYLLA